MAKYTDSNGLRYVLQKIKTLLTGYAKSSDIPTDYVSDVAYSSSTRKITKTKAGSASDVVTLSKVATSNSYADLDNKPTIPTAGNGALTVKVNDVSSTGSFTANQSSAGTLTVSIDSDDIPYDATASSPISIMTALDTLSTDKVDKETGKGLSTNDYTATEKSKLAGIAAGAEVNQNAFSNVKVGSTTVAADAKTDTLELAAGSNVTLTPDATNDKVTIAATNTKNTAGSTDSSSKLYLIGATSQGANPQTYSNSNVYTTNGTLYAQYFNGVSLDKGSSGLVIAGDDGQVLVPSGAYYDLGDACEKGVDTSIASGSTSTNVPTTAAVASFVASQVAGALEYKGAVSAESSLLNTALKKGWYYIVSMPNSTTTSITIGGVQCEAGDMVFVRTAGTYTTSTALGAAIDVVQANIDTLTNGEIDAIWNEVFA